VETIGSKRSYALIWCMPNNDDDDEIIAIGVLGAFQYREGGIETRKIYLTPLFCLI